MIKLKFNLICNVNKIKEVNLELSVNYYYIQVVKIGTVDQIMLDYIIDTKYLRIKGKMMKLKELEICLI